ncbi:MAG: hypothetical protein JOZ18_14655, partial [Chloroflexi bacterium]|nr:hypothetical protein [Chloroflexota bacterium]
TVASTNSSTLSSSHPSSQRLSFALFELIPHRIEDVTSSPLIASGADLDRSLRRVYAAIDGRKNLVELATTTHYGIKDVISALKALATLHRIELYGPEGKPVDSSLLPND